MKICHRIPRSVMKFIVNIFDEQKKERIREEKKEEAQNDGYY